MLLSYHLPITDLRHLLMAHCGKLSQPKWPAPSQRRTFVRGFGAVTLRNMGGDAFFGGGNKVSGADCVLRFSSSDPHVLLSDVVRFKVDCKFRRFFFFRDLAGKFELGFTQKAFQQPPNNPIAIDSLWKGLSDLPVKIRFPRESLSKPSRIVLNQRTPRNHAASTLGNCGPELALAYLYASTSSREGVSIEKWWVKSSPPIYFFEFNAEEPFSVPRHAQRLDCSDSDVEVYKYIIEQFQTVNYIIRRNNHNKARAKSRTLRVALSDHYCYLSSLYELLDALGPEKINPVDGTEHSNLIKRCLDDEVKYLEKTIQRARYYEIRNGDNMTVIPLDAAATQDVITSIQKWRARPPSYLRKFLRQLELAFNFGPFSITKKVT